MHEILLDLIEICSRKGVSRFVICPGSRSAPLTLALARNPGIRTWVVADERVAGFMALGMALQTGETVGLVCTSGTAVLNFAPAVAEAFFQEIPLLIFTADRPAEWIAQQDGQTLHQPGVYGKNAKAGFEIPADTTHPDAAWFAQRTLNEAIALTQHFPKGPVHLNFPLREPLYPTPDTVFDFHRNVLTINYLQPSPTLSASQWHYLLELWEDTENKLVVAAQHTLDDTLLKTLRHLQEEFDVPVVADLVSNLHDNPDTTRHADLVLMQTDEGLLRQLQPGLLITFGKSLVSKNLKLFLRKYKPRYHLHLQPGGTPADTFQTLTHALPVTPEYFFTKLVEDLDFRKYQGGDEEEMDSAYATLWQQQDRKAIRKLTQHLDNQIFNEFSAVKTVLQHLPPNCLLHLANSMPVRYANFLSLLPGTGIEVFGNRGTSGIDGCTSTALGAARMTDKPVVLLTGDMAFFYDRNAFWQPDLPINLRVILLNNHGGGIFRLIDAGNQPEVTPFFETPHPLHAANLALDFNLNYTFVKEEVGLQAALETFFEPSGKPGILEIETDMHTNEQVYKAMKKHMESGE